MRIIGVHAYGGGQIFAVAGATDSSSGSTLAVGVFFEEQKNTGGYDRGPDDQDPPQKAQSLFPEQGHSWEILAEAHQTCATQAAPPSLVVYLSNVSSLLVRLGALVGAPVILVVVNFPFALQQLDPLGGWAIAGQEGQDLAKIFFIPIKNLIENNLAPVEVDVYILRVIDVSTGGILQLGFQLAARTEG